LTIIRGAKVSAEIKAARCETPRNKGLGAGKFMTQNTLGAFYRLNRVHGGFLRQNLLKK